MVFRHIVRVQAVHSRPFIVRHNCFILWNFSTGFGNQTDLFLIYNWWIDSKTLFFQCKFQQTKHIDSNFFAIIMMSSAGAFNLFIYCFFGKLTTESFSKMADSLFNSNWQKFPIKLQKDLVLLIGNMQKPLHYHGFGIVVLNLETFCKASL